MDRLVFWLLKLFFTKFLPFLWRQGLKLFRWLRHAASQNGGSAGTRSSDVRRGSTAEQEEAQREARQLLAEERKWALHAIGVLQAESQQLLRATRQVEGPLRVWAEVLEQQLVELSQLERTWSVVASASTPAEAQALNQLPRQQLRQHQLRLAALRFGYDYRTAPEHAAMMADADAIALAQLQPLVEFSRDQNVALPQRRPVCFPGRGKEAIWFGLFPVGYPVIFVPEDFEEDLFRWPALAHEVGHLILREVPGLQAELMGVAAERGPKTLWDGADDLDTHPFFSAWLEEIFCDLVATLQLGPAAVRGMLYVFDSHADEPEDLVTVRIDERAQRLMPHPPPQLRVQLALSLLDEMGFHGYTRELSAEWETITEGLGGYLFPRLDGSAVEVTAETLNAPGRELIRRLYLAELSSLQGFRVSTIPGFSMTVGLWARVLKEAEVLGKAHYHSIEPITHADARVLIAAAIEARGRFPERAGEIARRVSRAIVGIDEVRTSNLPVALTHGEPVDPRADLLEALMLSELLAPKSALARHFSYRR